jgi:hypothetical protein
LTSPAEETEAPAPAPESAVISLLIAKPPVPDSMVDKLIAFVSVRVALLSMARILMMVVAFQSPQQGMLMVMARMI